jgi:hypothetical protein
MSKRDPLDQLDAFRLELDDEARSRDLSAIRDEVRRRPPYRAPRRSRWTLGAVVAVLLAGPVAAAASDDAAPGDLLYPIKLATEPIVRLFDRDAVAEHRVEEIAVLVDRDSENEIIEERIAVARDALAETDVPRLEQELDRIVDLWIADRPEPEVVDEPTPTTVPPRDEPTRDPNDRAPEPEPVDTPETTSTTAVADQPRDGQPPDRTTTTTAPANDGDRPPPGDRPRDTP